MGCRRGSVFNAYLYMINNGVNTYNCYPYRGRVSYTQTNKQTHTHTHTHKDTAYHWNIDKFLTVQQSYCSYSTNCTGAKMSGMVRIDFGNETDLQAALGTVGPVAVTIDGNSKAFRVWN